MVRRRPGAYGYNTMYSVDEIMIFIYKALIINSFKPVYGAYTLQWFWYDKQF